MYSIRPLIAGARRLWVNSKPSDLNKPNGPQFFRVEDWPELTPAVIAAHRDGTAPVRPRYGDWRGQLQLANEDAQTLADQYLQAPA